MNLKSFCLNNKFSLLLVIIVSILLLSSHYVLACDELWISNDTMCNGVNYTVQYFDFYQCNTTINLSITNGSIIPCSINSSSCSNNLCINPIMYNISCCVTTPVINCLIYSYELFDSNSTLIDSGIMQPFVNNTYYFMFNRDIGTYYVKICDDSTRQLIVEGDNMIGLTGQTWLLITLFALFGLFMWLSFKFDPLFMLLDGVIFIYFAFYSYQLYQSWFITVLIGMIGLLFMFVGLFAKIGQTTTN